MASHPHADKSIGQGKNKKMKQCKLCGHNIENNCLSYKRNIFLHLFVNHPDFIHFTIYSYCSVGSSTMFVNDQIRFISDLEIFRISEVEQEFTNTSPNDIKLSFLIACKKKDYELLRHSKIYKDFLEITSRFSEKLGTHLATRGGGNSSASPA